jgi:hypothetical protein
MEMAGHLPGHFSFVIASEAKQIHSGRSIMD